MRAEMKQVLLHAFSFSDVGVAASNTSEGLKETHNLVLNYNVSALSVFKKICSLALRALSFSNSHKYLKFLNLT